MWKTNSQIDTFVDSAQLLWEKLASFFVWKKNTWSKKTKIKSWYIYYKIKPFKDDDNILAYWQGFMSSMINSKVQIQFAIFWDSKNIKIIVKIPHSLKDYFENNFYSSFQNSELVLIDNFELSPEKYLFFKEASFYKKQDFIEEWVYIDPVNNVYSLFVDSPANQEQFIVFDYNFATWNTFFTKLILFLKSFFAKLFLGQIEEKSESDEEKLEDIPKLKISIWYRGVPDHKIKSIFNKLLKSWEIKFSNTNSPFLINSDSSINVFHLPSSDFEIKNLEYLEYKKLAYPWHIPTRDNSEKNDITLLGYTDYKNNNLKFGIRNEDKFRHMYVIGKTGMWKSTLISNMARSDMISNKWISVIDPHGDLVETLLEHIPSWRTNDVILFDVADHKYPIWFNILEYETEEEKNLVVSWIVWTFKKLYWDSWGPRLEYILRNVILSLIEYPDSTLLHLIRMLKDKNFREEVLEYVKDPIVIKFRREEFDKWNDKFKDDAIAPIVNKVGQFLSSPIVRNIFGQTKSKVNIRKIMDEGKILLINLSKWKIWEDNAAMIGSFIVTKFQIDAMSRADMSYNERNDFYLYIDEFQNFATDSFENILSEARKYKLSLILANQYISQISENIKNAIFGNVWTMITFGLWYDDANIISTQFKWIVSPNDIISLPKFKAYSKIMVDWTSTNPFSMTTFPLPSPELWEETKEKIKKQSRQRYAIEKERLEALIKNWSDKKFSKTEKAVQKAKEKSNEKKDIIEDTVNKDVSDKWTSWISLWSEYDWVVKLKYNYWLFVMVWDDEWLLHKKKINVPEWVKWKDMYEIWDPIKVKAEDFKDVNWEKKIVWTQI